MPVTPIRFQQDLTAALTMVLSGSPAHLCIGGPPGCGAGMAASSIARSKSSNVTVRVLPADLAAESAPAALDRLRALWRSATDGVLYVRDLEELCADQFAVAVLEQLRLLMQDDASVTVVLAGDLDAVSRLRALNPDLHQRFAHARTVTFTLAQTAELLVSMLVERGLQPSPDFAEAVLPLLARVRATGNLRNARVARALADAAARPSSRPAGALLTPADIDVSDLPLVSATGTDGLADLDALIGLSDVKATVRLWMANSEINARREQLGLVTAGMGQHMVFKGPAGTAKTTVARIVGRILTETGLLSSGHMIEVQRADLIAEQPEQTARRMVEIVKRALGGVLFIDEAYTLTSSADDDRTSARDSGREAVDTLLKLMEDYREEFVVIVAGYPTEMENFLNSNPGLRSRFSRTLQFPAYETSELLAILDFLAAQRGYRVEQAVRDSLAPRLDLVSRYPGFGNGRHVRNLLEAAIVRQATRLTSASTDEDMRTLLLVDFTDPASVSSHR